MVVEKEGSRGGGYVGGFFQLFDWKAKSRKKLFPNKSDFPENSKQGKRTEGRFPMTNSHLVDEEEAGVNGSIKACSDYSCASSVTDDDGYGARAPGVVARLMGLDSIPMSEQPYSTPFSDTRSVQEARPCKKNTNVYREHEYIYSGPSGNFSEPKLQRTPIEKFQTEVLPPRSAKSIPITHHKLLSPIKNPAFVSSKNAAHIMEAAARIIEPGPQPMPLRAKISHSGSSSTQLKFRDLREKIESSQKTSTFGSSSSSSSLSVRGRNMKEKVENSSKQSRVRQGESDAVRNLKGQSLNKSWNGPLEASHKASKSEDGCGFKTKGRSVSLAIQAKVNVQRREGLSSTSNAVQTTDDQKEWMMESSSSQLFRSQPCSSKKKSSGGVLRQNNQKQNCVPAKDRASAKSSVSNLHNRKASSRTTTASPKTGSRKFGVDVSDTEKGNFYSDNKSSPRKKRLIDRSFRYENSNNKSKTVRAKPNFRQDEGGTKNGSDVISFTFTTPLARSSGTTSVVEQKDDTFFGHNSIGGDALSKLLEQKLKELSYAVENSHKKSLNTRPSSLSESTDRSPRQWKRSFQAIEDMDDCIESRFDSRTIIEHKQPSPVSILEPNFSIESWNLSESTDNSSVDAGSKAWSTKKLKCFEADVDLSDSATSMSATAFVATKSRNSELQYLKQIVSNVESMFDDFVLGKSDKIIDSSHFDQLEDDPKLSRKLLFDCVTEFLEVRCRHNACGGFRSWTRGAAMVKQKQRLSDEVYREISGWRGMGDCMVDELVDKDMSSKFGNWMNFEIDAFKVGEEIQGQILDSLVEELLVDFFII